MGLDKLSGHVAFLQLVSAASEEREEAAERGVGETGPQTSTDQQRFSGSCMPHSCPMGPVCLAQGPVGIRVPAALKSKTVKH